MPALKTSVSLHGTADQKIITGAAGDDVVAVAAV